MDWKSLNEKLTHFSESKFSTPSDSSGNSSKKLLTSCVIRLLKT